MRKLSLALFCALLSVTLILPAASADSSPSISALYVDGQKVSLTPQAKVISGTVFAPMRSIFQRLGAQVNWNPSTQTVNAQQNSNLITLKIGSRQATVNSKKLTLSQAPKMIEGHVYVPLRFVSESLGAYVQWLNSPRVVTIDQATPPRGSSMNSADIFPLLNKELLSKGRLNHEKLGIGSTFQEVNAALGKPTYSGYDLGAHSYSYANDLFFYFEDSQTSPSDKVLCITLTTLGSNLTTSILAERLGKSNIHEYEYSDVDGEFMVIYRMGRYKLFAALDENNLNKVKWIYLFDKPNE